MNPADKDKPASAMFHPVSLHQNDQKRTSVLGLISIEEAQRISSDKNYGLIRKRLEDESKIISDKIRKAASDGAYSVSHVVRDLSSKDIGFFEKELVYFFPYYHLEFNTLDYHESANIGNLSIKVSWKSSGGQYVGVIRG